jgi:SAM-dependent methyltransferase
MPPFRGLPASVYDDVYRDKAYSSEARFVHRCLRTYAVGKTESLLEIACGTGGHALALERYGYDITAIDSSKDMIRRAEQKAVSAGANVRFRIGDMRRLPRCREPFDAAICLFDSIGHALTNEGVLKTLSGVRRNLRPAGLFVFEFWHAATMLKRYEARRTKTFWWNGMMARRDSSTTLDVKSHTATVTQSYWFPKRSAVQGVREVHKNRFFSVREMELFLATSGFEPMAFWNGYKADRDIDDRTWHIVAMARRRA